MATSRREYIFAGFILSLLCAGLIIVSVATDNWITTEADGGELSIGPSYINYGLFMGELILGFLQTSTSSPLHMTCVFEVGACAPSCKTSDEARRDEVRALAEGRTPSLPCAAATTIDDSLPLREPSGISSTFYVILVLVLFLHLLCALVAAGLAIFNATKNPTEPLFGVPGVRWSNVACGLLGLTVLVMWGTYWAVTDLHSNLAVAYTVVGELLPIRPGLGYSYWVILGTTLICIINVVLIEVRSWHLERDPAPPTITIENHSDGTIFLY